MKREKILYTVFCLFLLLNVFTLNAQELKKSQTSPDSLILVKIYNEMGGPDWHSNCGWVSTDPIKYWTGVSVINIDGNDRVIGLDLDRNKLFGSIPAEIGNLTKLEILNLSGNQISGSIPPEIGNLTELENLYLYNNRISGSIPAEITNLTKLEVLILHHNSLTEIPDLTALANASLRNLYIDHNKLTSFENIEPLVDKISDFSYCCQDSVGEAKTYDVIEGDDVTLSVSGLVGGTANLYQWCFRNDLIWYDLSIDGATSDSYTMSYPQAGYKDQLFCKISNSIATGLTFTSRIQTINVKKDPFEVWAEPKDPDIEGNSSTAIIPACEHVPAKIFIRALDENGDPEEGSSILFSIPDTSYGVLMSVDRKQRGSEVTEFADGNGEAMVYYSFTGELEDILYQEIVTAENLYTGTEGYATISVGLGLKIIGIHRSEAQAENNFSTGNATNLVVVLQSQTHKNLDLAAYIDHGIEKGIRTDNIYVNFEVRWLNQPDPTIWDKIWEIKNPDIVFSGICEFDKLGSYTVLKALDEPSGEVGETHCFPQIIPNCEGVHIYGVSAGLSWDFSLQQPVGNEKVTVDYPFFKIKVDRQSSSLEQVICAFSPTSKAQKIFIEMCKMYHPLIDFSLTAMDGVCKILQDDYVGGISAMAKGLAAGNLDLLNYLKSTDSWMSALSQSELLTLATAMGVKKTVGWINDIKETIEFENPQKSGTQHFSTISSSSIDINNMEFQDYINSFTQAYFNVFEESDIQTVTVINAEEVSLKDGEGNSAVMIDDDYSQLADMMGMSDSNIFCYILPKGGNHYLNLTTSHNTSVSIGKGGEAGYSLYTMNTDVLTGADLKITEDYGGNIKVDYGNDGTVDEEIKASGEIIISLGLLSDFSDSSTADWTDDGSGCWSVSDSIYVMTGKNENVVRYTYYNREFSDFVYQACVRKVSGAGENEFGLSIRSDGTVYNQYEFVISNISGEGKYRIRKCENGSFSELKGYTISEVINTGENDWNRMKIKAEGSSLEFYINDSLLTSIDDTSFSKGKVGFIADESINSTDTVQFDNVYLIDLTNIFTGIIDSENRYNPLPEQFMLYQNYPNPFNPVTTISFELPYQMNVILKVYNILGQEVKTLIDEGRKGGNHSVIWDGRNNNGVKAGSGIYLYKLTAGNFVKTKKMVLLK